MSRMWVSRGGRCMKGDDAGGGRPRSGQVSDGGGDGAQRAGSSAKTLEQPRQTYVTTLSEGESLLTARYQCGGGGQVQAPRFQSLCRQFHLRPCLQNAKCAAANPKGWRGSGCICFVPSKPTKSSITSASSTPGASTNLKRDAGKTEDSLCDWI